MDWTEHSLPVKIEGPDHGKLFHGDRTYFLVGCTGGLGQSLCRWMVRYGARYLALTSRNPSKVDGEWLQELRNIGAAVNVFALDVAEETVLSTVYEEICSSMPPIAGVANAAMVLEDKMFADMSFATLSNVLGPKIQGTSNLDKLFSKDSLDFFMLFSSLASVVGNRGQSNYGAANMFMTSLAAQRRKRRLAASVIDIGMILGIGYIAQSGIYETTLRRYNYMSISESEFHQIFAEAILAGTPTSGQQSEIITGLHKLDTSAVEAVETFWYGNPRFSHYVVEEYGPIEKESTAVSEFSIKQQLANVISAEEAMVILQNGILTKLGRVMHMRADSIDRNLSLIELGVDSLMAVEIRSWFFKELTIDVSVLQILGGFSAGDLCSQAFKKLQAVAVKREEGTTSGTAANKLTEGGVQQSQRAPMVANGTLLHSKDSTNLSIVSDEVQRDSNKSSTIDDNEPAPILGTHYGGATSESSLNGDMIPSSCTSLTESLPTQPSCEIQDKKQQQPGEAEFGDSAFVRVAKMSYAQARLWFLQVYLEDPTTYNVTLAYILKGPLKVKTLEGAFQKTIARHQALRTCFFTDPQTLQPMQGILCASPFRLSRKQLRDSAAIRREFDEVRSHVYDLKRGRTMLGVILSGSGGTNFLILGFHHIVFDGFSANILIRDLINYYLSHEFPIIPRQYPDYSTKQRGLIDAGALQSAITFWRQQFPTLPPPVPLFPFAKVRSRKTLTTYDMYTSKRLIDATLVKNVKATSLKLKTTAFHFHLSVLQILLYRLLGEEDLCIGITDANRTDEEFLETIGFFVNLLPLRFRLAADQSFVEILSNTRDQVYSALSHSQVPFDLLLNELSVPRSTTHSPLFQILLNYKLGSTQDAWFGDCHAQLLDMEDARNPYDLTIEVEERTEGDCLLSFRAQKHLYAPEDLHMLMNSYAYLLETISGHGSVSVEACSLFEPREAKEALQIGSGPRVTWDWPSATISNRVDEVIETSGERIAIRDDLNDAITYQQLGARTVAICSCLQKAGVTEGSFVAVLCEPSIDSICSLLAILRSGAIYVPLDLQNPLDRLNTIVHDCKPAVVVYHQVTAKVAESFAITGTPILNISSVSAVGDSYIPNKAKPDAVAFALYTSGSTGNPKGILIKHSSFQNQMASICNNYGLRHETVLQQSSLGFDVSLDQIFAALAHGGTLVVVSRQRRGDAIELAKLMLVEKVTYTYATPSEYSALIRVGAEYLKQNLGWRIAFCGGEALPNKLVRNFQDLDLPHLRLLNRYGPTEITVSSSIAEIQLSKEVESEDGFASIGQSLPNYSTYICDSSLHPVPVGYPGEICIGGAGVSLGYLNNAKLTQLKFVNDKFASPDDRERGWHRMYRTGDKGRFLCEGSLEYFGRMDGDLQVKLRGFRIELDDVENTILRVAKGAFSDAVVSVRGDDDTGKDQRFLVAFVTLSSTKQPEDLQGYLKRLLSTLPLPDYMCPKLIIPLEHLPTNVNGKTDRRAIDAIPLPHRDDWDENDSLTESERMLCRNWKKVLGDIIETFPLDRQSDFFEVGGNSMLLVILQALIRNEYGIGITLADLFQASSLKRMAALIFTEPSDRSTEPIDWAREISLPTPLKELSLSTIEPLAKFPANEGPAKVVLLTGATGFLGTALLRALVHDASVAKVHCVAIRSHGSGPASRLAVKSPKISAYAGDLSAPRLGLPSNQFEVFLQEVNLVIHNGADVSFLKSYCSLRKPNVESTRELLKMAQPRKIPIHFLSTAGVCYLSGQDSVQEISLRDVQPPINGSYGYVASKWVGECCLEAASEQWDVPATIHRPTNIVGEHMPSTDIVQNIIGFSKIMKAVPSMENYRTVLDLIDVTTVAWEICCLALRRASSERQDFEVFHHCSDRKISMKDLQKQLESESGHAFESIPLEQWLSKATTAGLSDIVCTAIRSVIGPGGGIIVPRLSKEHTTSVLKALSK